MGKEATGKGAGTGNPSENPEPTPTPTPDPAEELRQENERLKAENLAKDDQLIQKDQYISNLSNEKATLEERAKAVSPPSSGELDGRIASALEKAQTDPQEAGKDLAKLIQDATTKAQKDSVSQAMETIAPTVERMAYVNKVRGENKDLMDLGFEPVISARAQELSKTMTFNQAVDKAVKETKEKLEKMKSNTSTPPPGGSQGESGGNPPPVTPPPVKEPTAQEEIDARKEERRSKGL